MILENGPLEFRPRPKPQYPIEADMPLAWLDMALERFSDSHAASKAVNSIAKRVLIVGLTSAVVAIAYKLILPRLNRAGE